MKSAVWTVVAILGCSLCVLQDVAARSIPRPEHPRPQFQRESWINLNGEWDFALDMTKTGEEKGWHIDPSALDRTITVPFCPESRLSGIQYTDFMPQVWYHRTFSLPENWQGQRIFLHFGAVDYDTRVWVNGIRVGRHVGGSASFAFEITHTLGDSINHITVMARDEIRTGVQPGGKQSYRLDSFGVYYTRVTGIWQTVWLEMRPERFIERVQIIPFLDTEQFILTPEFDNITRKSRFRAVLSTPEGAETGRVVTPAVNGRPVILQIGEVHPWSPENPYLYDLRFDLLQDGEVYDRVQSYAGLRKFHIEGNRFYLNNEPIFLRFVLDQGFYPDGIWTAPDDQALQGDIERSIRVGFNGARLHQKVFEERFHYWADQLGYLTWREFDDWGSLEFRSFTNAQSVRNLIREWPETVVRDRNHPSIIAWTPLNETARAARADLDNYRLMTAHLYWLTRSLDPTRPVNDASGYVHVRTDIYTIHDYEQRPEIFRKRYSAVNPREPDNVWRGYPHMQPENAAPYTGQPYVVDEYGGTFWTTEYTDQPERAGQNRGNWGYGKTADQVEDRIAALTEVLLNNPNIAGFTYTQLTDIEQEVNGIYTYDRELKFHAERLREIFGGEAAIENQN